MRRKMASAFGLLAFALASGLAALRGAGFEASLCRAILAAAAMAVVGYVAGFIAEKAVEEAVERKEPLRPLPNGNIAQEATEVHEEEHK